MLSSSKHPFTIYNTLSDFYVLDTNLDVMYRGQVSVSFQLSVSQYQETVNIDIRQRENEVKTQKLPKARENSK